MRFCKFVVVKDQSEVCPVSRGVTLKPPMRLHYRGPFAFSDILYPHRIRPLLRSAYLVAQERYGLTLFRISDINGLGPVYPPVAFGAHVHSDYKNASSYIAFWLKPVSVFGLYMVYDVYQRFTYVDRTIRT